MSALYMLRVGSRILWSLLRGHPLLALAFIYPTHRCNLRCAYCSSPYLKAPEMSIASG